MGCGKLRGCGLLKRDQFVMSRRSSIAMCIVAGIAGVVLYYLNVPQKWDAATVGTLVPFWCLAGVFESRWNRTSFWTSFATCAVVHLAMTWFVFDMLLRNVERVGLSVWVPIIMFEALALYYLMSFLDRKLNDGEAR